MLFWKTISNEKNPSNTKVENIAFSELMETLRGGITTTEAAYLKRLASEVSSGCIVEVGSFRGKSSVALAIGLTENPSSTLPSIYCIEPHQPFVGFYGGTFGPEDRGVFYDVMVKTKAYKHVALINLSSEDVAPLWKQPVGLVFIDGDHRYAGVSRDFLAWDPHVLPSGIIAFDDAKDPNGGVYRLVEEIVASGRYALVANVGKITVLRKCGTRQYNAIPSPTHKFKILIPCHKIALDGGLLRFERCGEVLRNWGHEIAFITLSEDTTKSPESSVLGHPVLTWEQCSNQQWDAVMIPGAGFPQDTINKLSQLKTPNFGVRVQHILNDQTRIDAFRSVNQAFDPHVVVFNNDAWPPGSYTDFRADRFHVLCGAVDSVLFRPPTYPAVGNSKCNWIIGGQVTKNPQPLIDALEFLPDNVTLRLFGPINQTVTENYQALIANKRLELTGPLTGTDLSVYYRNLDAVVMTEAFAGWSNLVAEAMASGVPSICTAHGTSAFAEHEITALVVEDPEPQSIAQAVLRLINEPGLRHRLAENARNIIEGFTWEKYARELLSLLPHNGQLHYTHAPELGLFGKWPIEQRLEGLQPLFDRIANLSVVDFGAAEGVIAYHIMQAGARYVHGFEKDMFRVGHANALCGQWQECRFHQADLSDWDTFVSNAGDTLKLSYDVILYLGVHHHLPDATRCDVLRRISQMANTYIAIRTPEKFFVDDAIDSLIVDQGFQRLHTTNATESMGAVHIYEKI